MLCSYIVFGTFFSNLMAGILPFGAVFIELFFILSVSKHDISIKNYIIVSLESINIITD